jgi:hypothetical protein
MIAFYNGETEELIGTVKEVGGKLVADVESLKEYESYDPDEFYGQFSDWDAGYEFSMEIADGETAPKKYEGEHYDKTWTAEEVRDAQKR